MSPDLSLLVRAGHPVIAIESTDEDRTRHDRRHGR